MRFAHFVSITALLLAAVGMAAPGVADEPPVSPYGIVPPAPPPVAAFPQVTTYPSVYPLPELPACAAAEVPCAPECPSTSSPVATWFKNCPWFKQIAAASGIEVEVESCASPTSRVVVLHGVPSRECAQVCAFTVASDAKCACGDDCCCVKKPCKCGKACQCAKKTAVVAQNQCVVECRPDCSPAGEYTTYGSCPTVAGSPPCAMPPCGVPLYAAPAPGFGVPHPADVHMNMLDDLVEALVENAAMKAKLEFAEEKQALYETLLAVTVENARLEARAEQSEERLEMVQQVLQIGHTNAALQVRVAELERQLKDNATSRASTASRKRPTRR